MTIDIAAKAKALVDTVLADFGGDAGSNDERSPSSADTRAAWSPWGRDASAVGHLP